MLTAFGTRVHGTRGSCRRSEENAGLDAECASPAIPASALVLRRRSLQIDFNVRDCMTYAAFEELSTGFALRPNEVALPATSSCRRRGWLSVKWGETLPTNG